MFTGRCLFLLVGDVSAYHEEWLWFSATTEHGRAARDFASSSDCEVYTHEWRVPDLMLTDVSDLVGFPVGLLVGTLDHSAAFIDDVLQQPILHLGLLAGYLSEELGGLGPY